MSDYHDINAEANTRTRIGGSSYGTVLSEITVYKGGNYELCFYNGQELTAQEIITNPGDGFTKSIHKCFEQGLSYTLIFNESEPTSQKSVLVSVKYDENRPPSIAPLPLNE